MSTREEIREGIKDIIGDCLIQIGCGDGGCPHAEMKALEAQETCLNGIIQFLHSQGVAIRVDRELPSIKEVFPLGGVPKEFAKGLEYYRCFLMGTDYVSVEPII